MMKLAANLHALATMVAFLSPSLAQENGSNCSCAPSVFKFTFNFSSVCSPDFASDAISSTFCNIDALGAAASSDLTPVSHHKPIALPFDRVVDRSHILFQPDVDYCGFCKHR